jgi:cytochrome c oxidase subunit 3
LFWAGLFQPHGEHHADHGLSPFLLGLSAPALLALIVFTGGSMVAYAKRQQNTLIVLGGLALTSAAYFVGVGCAMVIPGIVAAVIPDAHHQTSAADSHSDHSAADAHHGQTDAGEQQSEQEFSYTGIFFSIYFAMTGVHALHILAGMGVITWLLVRSVRGDFSSQYFGPVDYVGLYWHLVDLVWIYLFPLLYLIH